MDRLSHMDCRILYLSFPRGWQSPVDFLFVYSRFGQSVFMHYR